MQESVITIEFIPDGSEDAPLLLIYGDDIPSARELFHSIRSLWSDRRSSIAIHDLPGFVGVGDVELYFHLSDKNSGVIQSQERFRFDCYLSADMWEHVEGLLEPFCDRYYRSGEHRYQWIMDSGEISVIYSTQRGW